MGLLYQSWMNDQRRNDRMIIGRENRSTLGRASSSTILFTINPIWLALGLCSEKQEADCLRHHSILTVLWLTERGLRGAFPSTGGNLAVAS
jgi:hypothetical protein